MASMNTILLKGDLGRRYEEARAETSGITPGHIIEENSNGNVIVHATAGAGAGGEWGGGVAIEDALSGPDLINTRGNTIDDAYGASDLVRYIILASGEIWNAILTTAQTVAKGDGLTSAGNGRLKKANGTTDRVVAIAEEAVTTTGATARIAARKV